MKRGLGTAALLAAVLLAGCGSQTAEGPAAAATRSDRLVDFAKKPPYVNALDVDPKDGSLLLTTNKGFWRIDPKTDKVDRVLGTAQAGAKSAPVGTFLEIKVAGPGSYVGSGHPDKKGLPSTWATWIEDAGKRGRFVPLGRRPTCTRSSSSMASSTPGRGAGRDADLRDGGEVHRAVHPAGPDHRLRGRPA